MNHTDFYARIRAIKEMEYRELYAAIELHGASYEWNSNDGECPVIAVNTGSVQPAPADVLICRVTMENGNLRLYGVENEYGNEVNFQPDEAFYNPQIEMFAHFKTKSSFHKTKGII